jgi:hypothetical protein
MNEQADHSSNETDGWPLPSQDVLRELEPPAVVWSKQEPVASWPLGPTARD